MSEANEPKAGSKKARAKTPAAPNEEAVTAYLEANPDFFVGRQSLLAAMTPPKRWKGDGIVDLQKSMLDRLRDEMTDLRNGTRDLVETSRSNMSSQARVHAAVLALMRAEGLEAFIHTVTDELPLLLDVDVASLAFESIPGPVPIPAIPGTRPLTRGSVDHLIGADRNVTLLREVKDDGMLFAEGAGLVRSAALARMRRNAPIAEGLLALGSRGATFHPGQGTELVAFLARVTEVCLNRWLASPDP